MKISKGYKFKESEFGGFLDSSNEFKKTFEKIKVTLVFTKSLEDGHWTCKISGSDLDSVELVRELLEEMDIKAFRARKTAIRALSVDIAAASDALVQQYMEGIATQLKREDETTKPNKIRALFTDRPAHAKAKTRKGEKEKNRSIFRSYLYLYGDNQFG